MRDLREQLAEVSATGTVAVLAEHLDSAVQYERITLVLRAAGRHDAAIGWARQGRAEKAGWPHADRLRDVLVDNLLDDGDTEAALRVRRAEFKRHPTAAAYRSLLGTAATVGADDPAPWALALLRDRMAEQPAYASELIVLLAAGQDEEAWRLGLEHREWLGERQWLALLDRRRTAHPAQVIEPYQDMVERYVLDSADKRRYRRGSRCSRRCARTERWATRRRSRHTWATCGCGTSGAPTSSRRCTPPGCSHRPRRRLHTRPAWCG